MSLIPTLPLQPRNRLAELILAALHDAGARRELAALAAVDEPPIGWLDEPDEAQHGGALLRRARRAATALQGRPYGPAEPTLHEALVHARVLFDAHLHFEVHEVLEPHWLAARGSVRDGLQGLIQIAVGYQHLANGNEAGARALLAEGAARLRRGRIDGLEARTFAERIEAALAHFPDATCPVPPFPVIDRASPGAMYSG